MTPTELLPRLCTRAARLGYRAANRWLRLFRRVAGSHTRGVRCVVRSGDLVLLVRHTYGERRWALPGGRVRRGEIPHDAARREISQELGLEVGEWHELGTLVSRRRRGSFTTAYLRADVRPHAVELDPVELSEAGWFPLAELPGDAATAIAEAREAGFL